MEGTSQGAIRQSECYSHSFHTLDANRVLCTTWQAGLAEYDEMEGIAWCWQSIDGAMVKAPLAQEAVGRNPTDRGKKRQQAPYPRGRPWRPAVDSRNRGKQT